MTINDITEQDAERIFNALSHEHSIELFAYEDPMSNDRTRFALMSIDNGFSQICFTEQSKLMADFIEIEVSTDDADSFRDKKNLNMLNVVMWYAAFDDVKFCRADGLAITLILKRTSLEELLIKADLNVN